MDHAHFESEVKIQKLSKIKKFAPTKKMKCDNNSIYELQERIYNLWGTPCLAL